MGGENGLQGVAVVDQAEVAVGALLLFDVDQSATVTYDADGIENSGNMEASHRHKNKRSLALVGCFSFGSDRLTADHLRHTLEG